MSVSVMADTTARGNPAWKNRPQRLRLIQPFDYSLEAVITNTRQAGLKQDVPRARAFYEAKFNPAALWEDGGSLLVPFPKDIEGKDEQDDRDPWQGGYPPGRSSQGPDTPPRERKPGSN